MLGRLLGAALVDLDRDPAQLLQQRPVADDLGGAVEVDVLVVVADLGLGRGGEDRLRQLVGLEQVRRQLDPADRAAFLVFLPARAGEVAADDALDRVHLQPLHPHRPFGDLLGDVLGDEVVGDDVRGQPEPEDRHPVQHLALVGDRRRHHHVVGGDAVGGDHQQVVVPLVDLADLAGGEELQIGDGGMAPMLAKPGGRTAARPTRCADPWHDRPMPLPPEPPRSPLWQTLRLELPAARLHGTEPGARSATPSASSFVGFERPMVLISDPAAIKALYTERRNGLPPGRSFRSNRSSAPARSCCSRARSTSPAAG